MACARLEGWAARPVPLMLRDAHRSSLRRLHKLACAAAPQHEGGRAFARAHGCLVPLRCTRPGHERGHVRRHTHPQTGVARRYLMPEMPRAREHHRNAVVVGGLDHFVVAHRPPGWITEVPASIVTEVHPRRERTRGPHHRTFGERLLASAAAAASSALRAAMRAESCPSPGRRQCQPWRDPWHRRWCSTPCWPHESEGEIGELGIGRGAPGHHLERHVVDHGIVARLRNEPPATDFTMMPARADRARRR